MNKNFLSVVIPFFNEEKEIENLFNDIFLFETNSPNLVLEYIFIDDKSNDNSLKKLKKITSKKKIFFYNKIIILSNKKNLGWSKSLRRGYSVARGKSVLFIPGDGEARLTEFLNKNLDFKKEILIFQRIDMSARPFFRIIISYIYRYLICFLFFMRPIDLNGLIILKSNRIKDLQLKSDSFFISSEIIIKSFKKNFTYDKKNYFKLFIKNKYKSSSLSLLQFFHVFLDILSTYKYLIIRRVK